MAVGRAKAAQSLALLLVKSEAPSPATRRDLAGVESEPSQLGKTAPRQAPRPAASSSAGPLMSSPQEEALRPALTFRAGEASKTIAWK